MALPGKITLWEAGPRDGLQNEPGVVPTEVKVELIERLVEGLEAAPGVRIYGITNRFDWAKRVATVSIRKEGTTPQHLAETLAAHNIFAWNGNFYAYELSRRLGVEPSGGLLRLGLVHYNTLDEVDRCLRVLERM